MSPAFVLPLPGVSASTVKCETQLVRVTNFMASHAETPTKDSKAQKYSVVS